MQANERNRKNAIKQLTESIMSSIRSNTKPQGGVYASKYKVINSPRCWTEACKMNAFPRIDYNPQKQILGEAIEYEFGKDEKGGIICFSTDVNAVKLSPNKIANWVKQKLETFKNRFTATRKVDKVAVAHKLPGWTIGHYLVGRYTDPKTGEQFGENSLSVEIVGISLDELIKIAEELCASFTQLSVLVRDYSTHRIFFVNPD